MVAVGAADAPAARDSSGLVRQRFTVATTLRGRFDETPRNATPEAVTAAVAVETNRQIFFGWLAVVFLVLALGAHPPTTVLASATVAALGLGAAWGCRARRKRPE